MKKNIIILTVMLLITLIGKSQTVKDLFYSDEVKVTWLGIDYSHARLIGDFSQFADAGSKSSSQMKDVYFPAWNNLILRENEKYDIKGMLRLTNYSTDVEMIMKINDQTNVKEIEAYSNPNYTEADIEKFVKSYSVKEKDGIGIVLITECLNKNTVEAYYHFVAFNMKNNEILLHKRLRGEPRGFSLKNYWAGSIYDIIKQIDKTYYKAWRKEYKL